MTLPAESVSELSRHGGDNSGRSKYRWFPGWTMLGIAAAAQYMSAPGQSYSVAAFKDPMQEGLGVSETDYSLAYTFATLVSAGLLPFVGKLVDRFGARLMLPLFAAVLGCGCWGMSNVDSLPDLYLGFGVVRSLGQGALALVSVWIVGEWFERRRGIATALAGLGGGISVMTVPLINIWMIQRYSWEVAWQGLAWGVWVLLVLPGVFVLRDRPEDLGLEPDGGPAASANSSKNGGRSESEPEGGSKPEQRKSLRSFLPTSAPQITAYEDSWTVSEALRDSTFWKLLSVPAAAGLVGTGLVFHQVALLGRHGLTPTWALLMMTLQAGIATVMQFPAGWITDRIASRYLLAAAMLCLASATGLVIDMPTVWLAGVYAVLLGLNGSVMRSTATVVWINYYGRAHQGAVRGISSSAMILGAALGPLPLAVSFDYLGSYVPALYVLLVLPLAAAVAVWTAHPPQRPPKPAAA